MNILDTKSIDKTKEFTFIEAWTKLFENNIITSKNSNYSYKIDRIDKAFKLKFYNPIIKIWQICTFFSSDELLDKWYVN